MTPETVTAYTALVAAAGSFVLAIWGTSWAARSKLADMEKSFRKEVASVEDDFEQSLSARLDSHKRLVGETLTAMSAKIAEVEKEIKKGELWGRDNYIRRPEFSDAISAIRNDFSNLSNRMEHKLDNIYEKLDSIFSSQK